MSDALRSLRKQFRGLNNLLSDVLQSERHSTSLDDAVKAFRTLGDGIEVTRWVLIEHFLFSFVEWSQLCERYFRYFGQNEESVPTTWGNLIVKCDTIRRQVMGSHEFDDLPTRLSDEWVQATKSYNGNRLGVSAVEELYDEIVHSDLRRRTASFCSWESEAHRDVQQASIPFDSPNYGWHLLETEMEEQELMLLARYRHADIAMQDELSQFIRNYRHATLRVSWLEDGGEVAENRLLFAFGKREGNRMNSFSKFLDDLLGEDMPENVYPIVDRVLGRIADAIHEIGYANMVSDIGSKDFVGGDDSPLGSRDINVIPGQVSDQCCPVLVAISRGSSRGGKLGFPKVLQQVKIHLTNCAMFTRAVIVLCDTWDTKSFMADHFQELRAHYRKGVRFLFLMVGAPDNTVSSVDVMF